MAIENIIATIDSLNAKGIAFASEKEYGKSIESHQSAKDIAYENREDLGIDYFLLSSANLAYTLRQGDRIETAELILSTKFPVITSYFADETHDKTFFGSARLNEEMGVLQTYKAKMNSDNDSLTKAVESLEKASSLYNDALKNTVKEIRDEKTIKDRLFRTYGLLSTAYTDLKDFNNAELFAKLELESRLQSGEKGTYNLMNAYHTLACVQTELARSDESKYLAAKENLEIAKSLSEKHVRTVLELRSAWLEYVRNPNAEDKIEECLDGFFMSYRSEGSALTPTLINYFRSNLSDIRRAVSGKYQCMIDCITRSD